MLSTIPGLVVAFLAAAALLFIAAETVRLTRSVTWATEAIARLNEIEREKLGQLAKMAQGGAPDTLVTRISELETALQGQKMLVADAVERVTSVANRQSARQRRDRAQDDLVEDADEPEPTAAQREALLKLLRDNGSALTQPSGTGGLSLKERARQHRAQRGE